MSETPFPSEPGSDGAIATGPSGPPAGCMPAAPSPWIARWLTRVRAGGRVLDFASGSGRHARMARAAGFAVLAVDRDAACLAALEGTGIDARQEDLEGGRWSFSAERFDAVICTNYLFRPRLDLMAALLAPGGLWLYETFAVGQARYGRPSNPAFLLRTGELLRVVQRNGLHLLAYEDGTTAAPRSVRVQRAVAVRGPFDPQSVPLV